MVDFALKMVGFVSEIRYTFAAFSKTKINSMFNL